MMIYKSGQSFAEKAGDIAERLLVAVSKWREYRNVAVAFAKPHIKKAEAYANGAANKINRVYKKNKKMAKRNMRMAKLRSITDIMKNLTVIGVALFALFSLIVKLFGDIDD